MTSRGYVERVSSGPNWVQYRDKKTRPSRKMPDSAAAPHPDCSPLADVLSRPFPINNG
jgi:hypothetical protein